MSLREIKENIDNFKDKDKEELIRYIHELLINQKRQENRLMSFQTEIKYMTRHFKKLRDVIDKILTTKTKEEETWTENKKAW